VFAASQNEEMVLALFQVAVDCVQAGTQVPFYKNWQKDTKVRGTLPPDEVPPVTSHAQLQAPAVSQRRSLFSCCCWGQVIEVYETRMDSTKAGEYCTDLQ
jgi:hypothetical protein